MTYLSRHRQCGCDCRDGDRWQSDPGIYNPLFATNCDDGAKPPCMYYARFECQSKCHNEWATDTAIPLRQLCEFGTPGTYYGILTNPLARFIDVEGNATFQNACSIAQRYVDQSWNGFDQTWWRQMQSGIRWTLDTVPTTVVEGDIATVVPASFTHTSGATYRMKPDTAWDCFGPNTLYRVGDAPANCPGFPTFVCIVPEVRRNEQRSFCCPNGFQATLPVIEGVSLQMHAVSQRLDFIPTDARPFIPAIQNQAGACLFMASMDQHYGADGGQEYACASKHAWLNIMSRATTGAPSLARIHIEYACDSSQQAIYECATFTCNGGTFNLTVGDGGFPSTITLTPHSAFASENDDRGPCPSYNCTNPVYLNESSRNNLGYISESVRYTTCDPWCECMPGIIAITCPSKTTQILGGCNQRTFCTGGRSGSGSLGGPSREYCTTATAADGTTHTVCVVVYANTSGAWIADWYCDGSFVSSVFCRVTCCPFTLKCDMPMMSCLPGCIGCLGINTDPICTQVGCCDPASEPGSITVTFASAACAAINGVSVVMTQPVAGAHYWVNAFVFSAFYIFDLRCASGVWTLGIHSTGCHVYQTSTNCVCTPSVSGSFAAIALPCVGPICNIGDLVSATIS